jgi:probable addiction module antidote protein
MPKRTGDFDAWLLNELTDPQLAAEYVNAAIREDPDLLPVVLREVAKAHTMKKVAEEAGVARESLYTSLSEVGNPTLTNLNGILKAVGLKIEVVPDSEKSNAQVSPPGLAIAGKPLEGIVRNAIGVLTLPSMNVRNPNTVNFVGAETSLGIDDLSFNLQSGIGACTRYSIGLRGSRLPYTPQEATQDLGHPPDTPKMVTAAAQTYLTQFASPASIGTQQTIH